MAPDGPTNIKVFVRWEEQDVFAGEEVKCNITFRNVARIPGSTSRGISAANGASSRPGGGPNLQRQLSSQTLAQARANNGNTLAPPPTGPGRGGHRASTSMSIPSSRPPVRTGSGSWTPTSNTSDATSSRNGHTHRRSISIVSLGSASTIDEPSQLLSNPAQKNQRPARGHTRSASLQIVSRGPLVNGPRSASNPYKSHNAQSPSLPSTTSPTERNGGVRRPSGAATMPNTPSINFATERQASPSTLSEFRFPQQPSILDVRNIPRSIDQTISSPTSAAGDERSFPTRPREPIPTINEKHATPAAKLLSSTSIAGTPRSSGEFYSLSNHSDETLASEYVTQPFPARAAAGRSPQVRRTPSVAGQGQGKAPEALMMGFAQVHGSFTLDGSLVNLGPFEEVKRKAVVGGKGGGVVGIETSKRDSGLLRGFGWGSITNTLGDLLGGGELSTIKEMRSVVSTKSVPLLSTPQSILFVDLQLAPGESKTYSYSFKLPKGLPPSHKGRAMKIVYNLVIGTQRPGGVHEQQVRSVEVPFRVLGSVNSHGEILGHDLMTPYTILRDQAKVQALDKRKEKAVKTGSSSNSAGLEFLHYVDELLNRPLQSPGATLLSPTAAPRSRRQSSYFEEAATAREAIDLAIIRSNAAADGSQSANRFEIARNGRRVGVVMLTRPVYRLGEVINMAVDFSAGEVPCYALNATLETAERVDPSLALRSEASIQRVTRKVYVSSSEATLYAKRVVFSPTIPVTATPEFVTSGLSLEWKIRLEFVVPSQDDLLLQQPGTSNGYPQTRDDEDDASDAESSQKEGSRHLLTKPVPPSHAQQSLLEEISRDDKGGLVLVAVENMPCESFEVAVPLRVYGAVCEGLERLDRDVAVDEGLAV